MQMQTVAPSGGHLYKFAAGDVRSWLITTWEQYLKWVFV